MIDVYEVIHLPEWEASLVCNDEALHFMCQWDYGEYVGDLIPINEARELFCRTVENEDYLLVQSITGDMILYRKWYGAPLG